MRAFSIGALILLAVCCRTHFGGEVDHVSPDRLEDQGSKAFPIGKEKAIELAKKEILKNPYFTEPLEVIGTSLYTDGWFVTVNCPKQWTAVHVTVFADGSCEYDGGE